MASISLLTLLLAGGCAPLDDLPPPPDGAPGAGQSGADDPDADGDGAPASQDCDDSDRSLNFDDLDGDGWTSCPAEGVAGDCDDANPLVFPGAAEICDDLDNDCDGVVADREDRDGDGASVCGGDCDDSDPGLGAFDGDGDGWSGCGLDGGSPDCDDADADVYPGAPELCDDRRNDCGDQDWVDDADTATFFGASGAADMRGALSAAGARVTLDAPGELRLCAGRWTAALRLEADVIVRGAGADRTTLDGGGEATVIALREPGIQAEVVGLTLSGGRADALADYAGDALLAGGGVACVGYVRLLLSQLRITGNAAELGAGLFAGDGCALTLEQSTVSGNDALDSGGGLMVIDYAAAAVADSQISDNTAGRLGGGASLYLGDLDMTRVALAGNRAGDLGGGLYLAFGSRAALTDSPITDNAADSGGGVHLSFTSQIALSGGALSDNQASYGGGLFSHNGVITLSATQVTGNTADLGGGLYLSDHSAVTATSTAFTANQTDDAYVFDAQRAYTWDSDGLSFTCDADGCE